MKRQILLMATVLAAILIAAPLVQAQPGPNRVGVIVRVQLPDGAASQEFAADVLRHVRTTLDEARGIVVVGQATLVAAQERLDLTLTTGSGRRQLQAVANLLGLDRLVVVHLSVNDRFHVEASALVYHAPSGRVLGAGVEVRSPNLESALLRAINGLLEELVPILS